MSADALYDGVAADGLAALCGVPCAVVFESTTSTLDVAHRLGAEGAPAGTLVIADAQTAGRGRAGRSWTSQFGAGVWLTLIERPADASAFEVLSLRVGLALAPALEIVATAGNRMTDTQTNNNQKHKEIERTAEEREGKALETAGVRLKWPNDLYLDGRKLGGILVEARWRDGAPEWVAIGVGINVRAPAEEPNAIGLGAGVRRLDVLATCVPAIRAAAARVGALTDEERAEFASRDLAVGRECVQPVAGTVKGIDASGALLVAVGSETTAVRSGSLVFKEDQ